MTLLKRYINCRNIRFGMNHTKVLFTNDRVSNQNTDKKLYCRVQLKNINPNDNKILLKVVSESDDPVLSNINNPNGREKGDLDEIDIGNFFLIIDILTYENDDFIQYNGNIDKKTIEILNNEDGFLKGIGLNKLCMWIYGLLIDGTFNDGTNYKFDLIRLNDNIYWSVKVLHFGLFKLLFKINVTRLGFVDIDEYFVDDLESYYENEIKNKRELKGWKIKESKYLNEIKILKDKNEINKLRNSVRLMKKRISNYFLPLVNSLLEDKKNLLEKLNERGDVVFSSSKKKLNSDNDISNGNKDKIFHLNKTFEEVKNKEDDVDLDWMQKERNKRMKLNQNKVKEDNNTKYKQDQREIEKELNTKTKKFIENEDKNNGKKEKEFGNVEEDSITFNRRERDDIIETQNDNLENKETQGSPIVIEEDTQLDEIINESTEVTDNSLTEFSE